MYQLPQRSFAIRGRWQIDNTLITKSASYLMDLIRFVMVRWERFRDVRVELMLSWAEEKMISEGSIG